jgi:GNAT superfamily N-acetyltransferase
MLTAVTAVTSRAYRDDADWRALRDLLVRIRARTGRWRCWTPDRIDGYLHGRMHAEATGVERGWEERIRLWHAPSGELVAALHPEGTDEAWLEVDPRWHRLVPEMQDLAEASHLARHGSDRPMPPLQAYATVDDADRQALFASRGYLDRGPMEVIHGRSLDVAGPDRPVPLGYRIRRIDLLDPSDRAHLIQVTRLAFPHAVSYDERDIDLEARMLTEHEYVVAVADDGTFASWCGVWANPEIGAGQFEPVGTHPDHRRRGLASAVMARGITWMRRRGLREAFVGTGVRNASNYLYASLGFRVAELFHQWELCCELED